MFCKFSQFLNILNSKSKKKYPLKAIFKGCFCVIISMVIVLCRMISFISSYSVDVKPYFNALVDQALHGSFSPHGDGWGMVLYANNEFTMKKSASAIWQVPIASEKANIAIIHARKITSGDVKTSFSHPFLSSCNGKDWSFAHNGGIKNFSNSNLIDTQFYFEKFLFYLAKSNDAVDAMKKAVEEIEKSHEYTSLNVLMSNGEDLYAFRKVSSDDDDYHSIFYKVEKDIAVFSTEEFGEGWEALKNGEYAHAKTKGEDVSFEVEGW
jgi:predicted glutamine amidotransferase